MSETITENKFRDFYRNTPFIEKSAISSFYNFTSKKKDSNYKGYPDFFKDCNKFVIVVEAKASDQEKAIEEVQFYMKNNKIDKDIIGIAISGKEELVVDYFMKLSGGGDLKI